MGYIISIRAEDGAHAHYCQSESAAFAEYASQVGRAISNHEMERWNSHARMSCNDDWGRSISLFPAPYGIKSARGYIALCRAYDNRECGIDTAKDRKMLEAAGW